MQFQGTRMRMDTLAINPAVDFPGDPVESGLCRKDLDSHVGQHEFDSLEIPYRSIELMPAGREVVSELGRARGRAACRRRNREPRLYDPVVGEARPLADLA